MKPELSVSFGYDLKYLFQNFRLKCYFTTNAHLPIKLNHV